MKRNLFTLMMAVFAVFALVLTGCESDVPTPNNPEIPEEPENGEEEPEPKPVQTIIKATYTVEAGKTVDLYSYTNQDVEKIFLEDKWIATNNKYTFTEAGEYTFTYHLKSDVIGEQAFIVCSSLTSVEFCEGVTSIGNSAFHGCTSLASVDFPSTLTTIGESTFQSCFSLTEIDIPEGVTSIGKGAFYACSGLKSITLPSTLESIGRTCFFLCKSLGSITCKAMKAPTLVKEVFHVKEAGVLTVPTGATGYDVWMKEEHGTLGFDGLLGGEKWTIVYSDYLSSSGKY